MAEGVERYRVESAYTSLCHELTRLLGPIKPRMGTTTNDQLIAKVGEILTQRDQARQRGAEEERERQEADRCKSCDDTGIYQEGDEWAPCEECERGRGLVEHFKTARREAAEEERELLRGGLMSDSILDVATGAAYTQPISSNRREDMRAAFIAALAALDNQEGE